MSNIFQTIKYLILNVFAFLFIITAGIFVLRVGFAVAKVVAIAFALIFAVSLAISTMINIGMRLSDTTNRIAKKMRDDYGF